jgi:hypothetical protein
MMEEIFKKFMSIPGSAPTPRKIYPGSTDEESKLYFDMSVNDTAVYGGFSVGPEEGEGGGGDQIVQPPSVALNQIKNAVKNNINNTMNDFIQRDVDVVTGGDF